MRFFTAICLLMFLPGVYAQETNALVLEKTIPLENVAGRIDHLVLDGAGQRLFIAALGNSTVEVVDLKSGKRLQSLTGFAEPQGLAYVPEFDKLFVANGSEGTCRIFDGHSFKLIGTVVLGDDADNVRYDEAAKRIYVGYGDGALAAIDAKTGKKIFDVKLKAHPESFCLETNGPRLFVNVPGKKDMVVVVDREKKKVTDTWLLKGATENFPMVLDEADHRLFVGCRDPGRLLVFDTTTGKTVGDVAISADADDLFYDPARKRIYISCGVGSIDVVRQAGTNSYQLVQRITTAAGARTSLFSTETGEFYLAVRAGVMSGSAEIRIYKAP